MRKCLGLFLFITSILHWKCRGGYRTHPRQCKQEQNDQCILDYAVLPQQPSNLQAEDSTDAAAELADQHTEVGPKRVRAIWHGMRLPSHVKWRSAEKAVGTNWNEETGLPCWFEKNTQQWTVTDGHSKRFICEGQVKQLWQENFRQSSHWFTGIAR